MPLSNIPISDLGQADFQRLVSNEVGEGRRIEYKLTLPGPDRKEKREFLADVSAMANAWGGDIIYGIDDERDSDGQSTGVPGELTGLSIPN